MVPLYLANPLEATADRSEVAMKAGVFGGAEMEGLESALLWRVG